MVFYIEILNYMEIGISKYLFYREKVLKKSILFLNIVSFEDIHLVQRVSNFLSHWKENEFCQTNLRRRWHPHFHKSTIAVAKLHELSFELVSHELEVSGFGSDCDPMTSFWFKLENLSRWKEIFAAWEC